MTRASVPRTAAIAQDWLAAEAGSERVTLELSRLLPAAEIYTSFFRPSIFERAFDPGRVHTWPLQRLLGPTSRFRLLLPFYPAWFSMLDLRRYDLVVSSSVAFTHAVRTAPGALHISYVHTPIRYAWDLDAYLGGSSWSLPARVGARTLRPDPAALGPGDRGPAGRAGGELGRRAGADRPPVGARVGGHPSARGRGRVLAIRRR